MKKNINKNNFILSLILLSAAFCATKIYSVDLLITTSGTYQLDDDILSSGDATNGTIRIQSSYVTLDLNTCFIQQTTNTANCNGIQIDPGLSDIVIKNGTINGFTLNGISVGANCNKININNLIIENCTAAATAGSGITVASGCANIGLDSILTVSCTGSAITFNTVFDSSITKCRMISCGTNSVTTSILNLNTARQILVSNCFINSSVITAAAQKNVINLSSLSNSIFKDIFVENVSSAGSNMSIFNLVNVTGSRFINCDIFSCSSGTIFSGFYVPSGTTSNCQFDQCAFENNASSGTYIPFYVNSTFQGNLINEFRVIGNSTLGNGFGIYFSGGITITGNVLKDCIITNNSNSNGFTGFYLGFSGPTQNMILRLNASYNSSSGGIVNGLSLNGTYCTVQDCVFQENNEPTGSNSYGINYGGSNCLFIRNIAYANGGTAAVVGNQLFGVPVGTYTNPGGGGAGTPSIRMNSAMSPWGNLRMTS